MLPPRFAVKVAVTCYCLRIMQKINAGCLFGLCEKLLIHAACKLLYRQLFTVNPRISPCILQTLFFSRGLSEEVGVLIRKWVFI